MDFDPTTATDLEFDPTSAFDPNAIVGEETESKPKNKTDLMSYVKDVVRFFTPVATQGVNAIVGGVEGAVEGTGVLKGAMEKAQSDDFFGLKLSMDTAQGKAVEEAFSNAFVAIREFMGDNAIEALTNDKVRSLLKAFPAYSPILNLYEEAPDAVKTKMEDLAGAGASAAPELAMVLLGGGAAKKASKKKSDTPPSSLDDIIAMTEEENAAARKAELDTPLEFDPKNLVLEEEGARLTPETPEPQRMDYEGGIEYYGDPENANPNLSVGELPAYPANRPDTGLTLAPRAADIGLETVDQANARLDATKAQLEEMTKGLDLEPLPETNKPLGQSKVGRSQRGAIGEEDYSTWNYGTEDGTPVATEVVDLGTEGNKAYKQLYKDKVQQPTNLTEIPLGQRGFGKSQGGGINLGAFSKDKKPQTLMEKAKIVSKDKWIEEFKQTYPDKANLAESVYNKVAVDANGKQPLVQAVKENSVLSPILETGGKITKGVDYGLGAMETRVSNISPRLGQRVVNFEQANLGNTGRRLQAVDPFLESLYDMQNSVRSKVLGKANPKLAEQINEALLQNDKAALDKALLSAGKDVRDQWKNVEATIKELGKEAQEVGVLPNLRSDYLFPRIVTDYDGLVKALGRERSVPMQRALNEARRKATLQGRKLTPIEESMIINKALRGYGKPAYKTPFSKERKFKEVPDELKKFYASPSESLHTYVRGLTSSIEEYKLFGRNLTKNADGTIDFDASIGKLVADELNANKLTPEQVLELESLIRSRFTTGQQGISPWLQSAKDLVHGSLLGSMEAAAIQFADVYPSIALNGIKPTLIATMHKALGKEKITANDLGLVNVISEDFVGTRWSTKLVNSIFKPFFTRIDRWMKDVSLNSSYIAFQNGVANPTSPRGAKFIRDYAPRFGEDFPQLVQDLKEGKRTALTDQLVFNELHNRQPISRSKRSQFHLDNPNLGGTVMTLKSFAMAQGDMVRKYVYNEIKNGNKKDGLAALVKLTAAFYVANASMQSIKNFWLYGELEPDNDNMVGALLRTFGWSSYLSDDLMQGKFGSAAQKVGLGAGDALAPAFASLKARVDGDPLTRPSQKDLKLIPWVGGKLYAETTEAKIAKRKREMKEMKEKQKEALGR